MVLGGYSTAHPPGQVLSFAPRCPLPTANEIFENCGLEDKTLGFRIQSKGDLWVSSSLSHVLILIKIPPLHQHLQSRWGLLVEEGPLHSVSFLVRMSGTSLGRKRNNTPHIFTSNCQKHIREFGLDVTCLPHRVVETIWIPHEYLGGRRNFGDQGRGAEKELTHGCILDSGLKT